MSYAGLLSSFHSVCMLFACFSARKCEMEVEPPLYSNFLASRFGSLFSFDVSLFSCHLVTVSFLLYVLKKFRNNQKIFVFSILTSLLS